MVRSMDINISKVNKIILSDIEVLEYQDGHLEQRAIEVYRTDGEKILITLDGSDLRLFGESEKEYIKKIET